MEDNQAVKKICIDARFYRRSTAGVGRYTRGLIHHLQKIDTTNNYTVILTPADAKEWPEEANIPNWDVKVLDVPHFSFEEQTDLLDFLETNDFDLVHFTQFNHPIRYSKPFVVTIHDLILHMWPSRPIWHPRTWAYRYVMRHAASAAKRVIAPSHATKHDIIKFLHANEDKIDVIVEAVEDTFKPEKDTTKFDALQKKYGITKPFLYYLNAWRPHKGLPELVEAYLTVKQTHDIQIIIGGKPDPAFPNVVGSVDAAKAQSNDIITPGFIPDDDAIVLMSMAEAFVVPTHYEGFGIPPLEAMQSGCPVIVADSPGVNEVVGDAGLTYKTGDAKALAKTIDTYLTTPKLKAELRDRGFKQAKKFSYIKMAEETLELYQKAMQ